MNLALSKSSTILIVTSSFAVAGLSGTTIFSYLYTTCQSKKASCAGVQTQKPAVNVTKGSGFGDQGYVVMNAPMPPKAVASSRPSPKSDETLKPARRSPKESETKSTKTEASVVPPATTTPEDAPKPKKSNPLFDQIHSRRRDPEETSESSSVAPRPAVQPAIQNPPSGSPVMPRPAMNPTLLAGIQGGKQLKKVTAPQNVKFNPNQVIGAYTNLRKVTPRNDSTETKSTSNPILSALMHKIKINEDPRNNQEGSDSGWEDDGKPPVKNIYSQSNLRRTGIVLAAPSVQSTEAPLDQNSGTDGTNILPPEEPVNAAIVSEAVDQPELQLHQDAQN